MATVTQMNAEVIDYEQARNARIEENKKRMQELGLHNLAKNVSEARKKRPRQEAQRLPPRDLTPLPPRRSSRLQNATPVSYSEIPKWNETSETIYKPEIYTEEHEKLLGSCESEWVLFQDGYGSDGTRIYNSVKGKTCHQCRQKTLGLRTQCSTCNLVQGQFCGDCLFMRYGENVLEVNKNPEWVCPVCRGICNCSLCRIKKGWAPTGYLYRKVKNQGFKSVAHYLILTRRASTQSEITDAIQSEITDAISSSSQIEDNKDDTSLNAAKRSLKFASSNLLSYKRDLGPAEDPDVCDIKMHHSDGKIVPIAASQIDCGDAEVISKEEPENDRNQRELSTQNGYEDVGIISFEELEQDKNQRESSKIAALIISNEEPEKDKSLRESTKGETQNGYGDVGITSAEEPEQNKNQKESSTIASQNGCEDVDTFSTDKAASQVDYGDVETFSAFKSKPAKTQIETSREVSQNDNAGEDIVSTEKPKHDKNQIGATKAASESDWGDVEIISVQESKQYKNQRKPSRRNTYPQGGIAERLRARTARKPSSS